VTDEKGIWGPADWPGDPASALGRPGEFPFTRGVHPTMYRGRLWTMRQYAGFGTAEETNRRFRDLLAAGQTGLSVAFDLPTQMGYDSDQPMAEGEVGRAGVAIDTVEDLQRLFHEIPLDRVSTSMTINATAAILLAMYVVVGEEQGVPHRQLEGTLQNDILKEYIARGTYIYPLEPSLRLTADVFRFTLGEGMRFNPISISGYHIREAGATAVQEVAFTFANGLEYVRRALAAGLDVNVFAPRLSFFFAAYTTLFEEVAKFRAARRLWARLMKEQFGAAEAACRLRFHTQTGGATLTAQQPLNNVVRVALQAMAAVLGGTQSLHTNAYDEALALPTKQSATLALRTQQVLAHETGLPEVVDPIGGSWYIEALTDTIEREARALLAQVEQLGGAPRAIENGFFQEAIARSAYAQQRAIETRGEGGAGGGRGGGRGSGEERVVIGVNEYADDSPVPSVPAPDYSTLAAAQRARLADVRRRRPAERVRTALDALRHAAREPQAALMPLLLEAVRARATVGEISDVLREVWGEYRPT
jgi:methylmalonyl-CoA mutase N-terminal domain/subunit